MQSKSIQVLAQRRAFLQAANDLSADFVIQEALSNFYETHYKEKIEEALILKDEEMFNTYTELLKNVTN